MEIRADLHIHTVLSPCGDLDMSPANIIGMALQKGLSLIGISDHNSTRQAPVIQQLGEQQGLRVLCGTEVNTAEEVHALAYFPTLERLTAFQHFLDLHLPDIKNNPDKFGYQVVVDAEEQITYEEERLLITALDVDINTIERTVHALDGIFIPAHIDKSRFIYHNVGRTAIMIRQSVTIHEQYLRGIFCQRRTARPTGTERQGTTTFQEAL